MVDLKPSRPRILAPLTDTVRLIVATEVIIGVMLLLFGFSEIFRYAQRHIHGERD